MPTTLFVDRLNRCSSKCVECLVSLLPLSRSLFEKDKLLFAFTLASKLQIDSGKMSQEELRFLLTGGIAMSDPPMENPAEDWISSKMWGEICRVSELSDIVWETFYTHFAENSGLWKKVYDSVDPEKELLPSPWQTK